MDGTNKIVAEILEKYLEEVSKLESVDSEFTKKLAEILKDSKSVTAAKLEQVIYNDGATL